MSKEKKLTTRLIAILLIVLGIVLGVTWNSAKFCIGDNLFNALGLPAWSNGINGAHYPAIIGAVIMLVGISLLNYTFQKKERLWVWPIVILVLAAIKIIFSRYR